MNAELVNGFECRGCGLLACGVDGFVDGIVEKRGGELPDSVVDIHSMHIKLRSASAADLDAVNRIVKDAVSTWQLPERVKRLAMPTYLYTEHDLHHLQIVVVEDSAATMLGVATWEQAAERDCPPGQRGLLLHGLYVDPDQQGHGTGSFLLSFAFDAAREQGYDELLLKAQADAEGFFSAKGLQRLVVENATRDYSNRFWLDIRK